MTYDLILTLWVILNRMATIPNTLPVQRRSGLFGRCNPGGPGRRLCLFWYVLVVPSRLRLNSPKDEIPATCDLLHSLPIAL